MSQLLYGLAVLACPLGMGVIMWFMMRGGKKQDATEPNASARCDELTRLQAEIDQLQAAQRQPRPDRVVPSPRP